MPLPSWNTPLYLDPEAQDAYYDIALRPRSGGTRYTMILLLGLDPEAQDAYYDIARRPRS